MICSGTCWQRLQWRRHCDLFGAVKLDFVVQRDSSWARQSEKSADTNPGWGSRFAVCGQLCSNYFRGYFSMSQPGTLPYPKFDPGANPAPALAS